MTQPASLPDDLQRRHPIVRKAVPGSLLRELIDEVIPDYAIISLKEDRARAMLRAERTSVSPTIRPAAPEDINDTWLNDEVERRRALKELDNRREILQEVVFEARREGISLIEDNAEELVEALDERLQQLITTVQSAVEAMGPDVHTAADAIQASAADQWKILAHSRTDYDAIRATQRALYQADRISFDGLQYGDGVHGAEPEARKYYHRRLDQVAPRWRGWQANGQDHLPEYPWPSDPVEQLVWFIRNDSGIWCPTPQQLSTMAYADGYADVPKRNALQRGSSGELDTIRNLQSLVASNGY